MIFPIRIWIRQAVMAEGTRGGVLTPRGHFSALCEASHKADYAHFSIM